MQLKRGLGRGLESLIPPMIAPTEIDQNYRKLPINSIVPNRLQPRTIFDEEKIKDLAESIRSQGIIQPLIVSPLSDGRYELIAGERRLRASRLAGLPEVPVVIKKVDDDELLTISIIENIQREDLNPIEEAHAYEHLSGQFGFTHDDVAKKVGKSRAAVANSIRLLKLPRVIQEDVSTGRYSAGHARAVLSINSLHEQLKVREKIIRDMPTVRDVEKMVQSYVSGGKKTQSKRAAVSTQINKIIEDMKVELGTKVSLHPKGEGGKIVVEYYSGQDLNRIAKKILG